MNVYIIEETRWPDGAIKVQPFKDTVYANFNAALGDLLATNEGRMTRSKVYVVRVEETQSIFSDENALIEIGRPKVHWRVVFNIASYKITEVELTEESEK